MTLYDMYINTGLKFRFRVRNTKTLQDYLTLTVHERSYGVRYVPKCLMAYSFSSAMYVYLDCFIDEYALLSTTKEIKHIGRLKSDWLIEHISEMYRKNSENKYLPFGLEFNREPD